MTGLCYRKLAFHLEDSQSYRQFCRLGWFEKGPSKSTLQRLFKQIRPETLEVINRELVQTAHDCGVEKCRTVRADATNVESNIHPPQDSSLLWDCVRVLTRLMKKGKKLGAKISFADRTRRTKKRHYEILNTNSKKKQNDAYLDLMKVAQEVLEMAQSAMDVLARHTSPKAHKIHAELIHFTCLAIQVLDQTYRRIIEGEKVPACEKIVSIFEEHTDILKKEKREVQFGHKIFLTAGKSMILDCMIVDGNPNDSTLAEDLVVRHIETFQKPPRQVTFDGGFASKENLSRIKELGVKDVVFSKGRGISILDMAKSSWVYKKLRRFRAGIEGNISFLKRSFGLGRCTWRSKVSFHSYIRSSVLAFNLLVFARNLMS